MFPRIRTASSYLLPLRMIPADDPLKFSLLFFFFSFPSFRSPNRVFRGTIKAPLTGVWPGSPALVKRSQARTATQRKMIIRSDLFDLELALTFNARPVRPLDPPHTAPPHPNHFPASGPRPKRSWGSLQPHKEPENWEVTK